MRAPALSPSAAGAERLIAFDLAPAALRAWRAGQLLAVTVLRADTDGSVCLGIDGMQIAARSRMPLDAGTSFLARVERPGDPVILRCSRSDSDGSALARAWRAVLPQQRTSLSAITAALADLARHGSGPAEGLLGRLLDAIPELPTLARAEALRQALRDSGLFLEARLAAAERNLEADLKAHWLRLARWARAWLSPAAAPPAGEVPDNELLAKILQQAEAALAGIQLHQLATLASAAGGGEILPSAWFLELPVRDQEHHGRLRWRIVAEDREPTEVATASGAAWSVTLELELPSLGTIHARVRLHGERVAVAFWAERASTIERLRAQLDALGAELQSSGLEIGVLACHDGPMPSPPEPAAPGGLLDEQA